MPQRNSEGATWYRARALALYSLAQQTKNNPAREALQGVAVDYELVALYLETKDTPARTSTGSWMNLGNE